MHVSRSFVSQTVRMLEKVNLISKQFPGNYNSFYQLSPELKTRYPIEEEPEFIHTRVHNIRRKYRILNQTRPVSLDKRLGFLKEWEMRGGKRYKFWYSGAAGSPRIQIDVQPGSLIVYPDAKQDFLAETELEAEDMANIACHNAALRFVREQAKFGVHLEIDEIGKQIVPIHYGFPMPEGHPLMAGGIKSEDEWTDGSPGDGTTEYETTNRGKATALSEAIDKVKRVDSIVKESIRDAMPEAMREFEQAFAPLKNEIGAVMAYVQSGQSVQNQLQQLTFLVGKQLADNHALQNELSAMRSGKTVTRAEPVYRSAYTAPSYEE